MRVAANPTDRPLSEAREVLSPRGKGVFQWRLANSLRGGLSGWPAYVAAVLFTTATVLVSLALGSNPGQYTLVPFIIPIMLSVYLGGLGPGLLACGLSALCCDYFFFEPAYSLAIKKGVDQIHLMALIVSGAVSCILMESQRRGGQGAGPSITSTRGFAGERKVQGGFVFALMLLIAIGFVSYFSVVRLDNDARWVDHTHQVIGSVQLLVSAAADAELASRGYALTGAKGEQASYRKSAADADEQFLKLRVETQDNPAQQKRLNELAPILTRYLANLASMMDERRNGVDPFASMPGEGLGADMRERLRESLRGIEAAEQELLNERAARTQQASVASRTFIAAGSAVTCGFILVALFLIMADFAGARRAQAELSEAHENLETRVRQRTDELHREQTRINEIARVSPGIICSFQLRPDGSTCFPYASPAIERIYGMPPELLREDASPIFAIVASEDIDGFKKSIAESAANLSPWRHEWRVSPDGKGELWLDGNAVPTPEPDGSIVWHGVVTDVTQRKRAEVALRRSKERLARSQAIAHLSSVEFYPRTGGSDWTDEHYRLLGLEPRSVKPDLNRFLAMVHPEDRDFVMLHIQRFHAGQATDPMEYRINRPSGEIRWVRTQTDFDYGPDGELERCIATSLDITEEKRSEQELIARTQDLQRSNSDLEQFAYVASHDLQEPLRAVAGCVQILRKRYMGSLDSRADELIAHTVEGAERMRTLIEGLLAYSRVGRRDEPARSMDLERAVRAALTNLTAAIQENGAVITEDALPAVTADSMQMTLLFQNLIANAIKFKGALAPRIHIGAELYGRESRIYVRDNGIGIEPEYFQRIFGVFQRLHTRNQYPGTGIGLAICKRIVERHGGRIWVESLPGQGSTFWFTLPAPLNPAAIAAQEQTIEAQI